jgi:uncharacterized lipoprotein YmbA
VTVLTKSSDADKAIIIKRTKVDEQLIQTAKRICRELFNKSDLADDEDGLIKDIRNLIEQQIADINALKARYEGRKYPGTSLLDKGLEYFEVFHKGLDNASFFTKLKEMEDDLLDWEEDIVYVKSFFENQKDIFDKGLSALKKHDENKAYLSTDDSQGVVNKLHSILKDPIPYRKIKEIPELVNQIDEHIESVLNEKKDNAKEKIKVDQDYLVLLAKQYGVNPATKEKVEAYYNDLQVSVDTFKDIYKVDATISQSASFKEKHEIIINQEIKEWQRKKEKEIAPIGRETGETETTTIPVTTIQKEKVKVTQVLNIRTLTSEEDVDQFVNTLSATLKQIIKSNKHIEFID